jgi:aminotransferase
MASSIERAVTPKTRAVLLLSPNNPTGTVYDHATIEEIAEIAQSKNLIVITDEVYEKFVYDDVKHTSIASLPGMEDRTIVTNSFSKTYAMTGWRIGYAAGNTNIIQQALRCHYAFNMSAVAFIQKAAIAALTGPQDDVREMIKEYAARRKIIVEQLQKIKGVHASAPKGAFYVFPRISDFGINSMEFAKMLAKEAHVATVPGSAYGEKGEGHIRISFAASRNKILEACNRLARITEKLSR